MKITLFGSGYVGLVTGACFAEVGNDVLCVDVDPRKVALLQRGEIPIHEPGLDEVVQRNGASGRLRFTTDVAEGVAHGLFQFIAVGTPPDEDGSADLQHVRAVARSIGQHLDDYRVVVNKSTVPVGTADVVRATIAAALAERGLSVPFSVVSNPEFLKEGVAVQDFMRPDRIIVGSDDHRATLLLRNLYAPFNRNRDRLIEMDVRSAELTKYAANAMLATKISFMNEMANLAERLGADIEKVRVGIGADPRIGYHFIYPGAGFGGSCFPKDVKALEYTARSVNYEAVLLRAVEAVNQRQKTVLFAKIRRHFGNGLRGRTFALWGLAFKPGTDDMREAPSRNLLKSLWDAGCVVRAYDPAAMNEARHLYGERPDFQLCGSSMDTLTGADALVIMTEWSLFRSPDFDAIRQQLRQPVIFDGRNLYDPDYLREQGFTYYAIGRGEKA
ncbi:MAG: UDP-glucose/GDP-mannose dehydrogenase family protein [Candidatus Contendobacter sp.]|nr:UDP-glucose/GDP-mannose dehydrogenase family protein [Candidatus Contendobacter sp.]